MRPHTCIFVASAICFMAPLFAGEPTDSSQTREQFKARDRIEARIVGQLNTVWDTGKLYYATVEAGGTQIEIDPAECPLITQELLEYPKAQGGAFVTGIQAEVVGRLRFEKFSRTGRGKHERLGDPDSIVPVLTVESLKITTLPVGSPTQGNHRDRKTVHSTTVGVTKP